jgi:hypothetical protein
MSKDPDFRAVHIAFAAMLALLITSPAAAEPKSPTGGTPLCKEQCEKSCMGNDTPTERSNCLIREKCGDRTACPKDTTTAPPPKRLDQTGGTVKPPKTYQVPKAATGGVLQQ